MLKKNTKKKTNPDAKKYTSETISNMASIDAYNLVPMKKIYLLNALCFITRITQLLFDPFWIQTGIITLKYFCLVGFIFLTHIEVNFIALV